MRNSMLDTTVTRNVSMLWHSIGAYHSISSRLTRYGSGVGHATSSALGESGNVAL